MLRGKVWMVLFISLIFLLSIVIGCAAEESAVSEDTEDEEEEAVEEKPEPVVWKALSALPQTNPQTDGYFNFINMVEEELGDYITIEFLGSSEIVAAFEQPEAVGMGNFEMAYTPISYCASHAPAVEAMGLSTLTPWEERERGVYAILEELLLEELNIIPLLNTQAGVKYNLYTNFEVNSLDDFRGKDLRSAPPYEPLMTPLGIGQVSMDPGDIYSGMERGVVQGFAYPQLGVVDSGLGEVTKYRVEPAFWEARNYVFINADAWNALTPEIKEKLMEIALEAEKEAYEISARLVQEELAGQEAAGIEAWVLPDDIAEAYLKTAYDGKWNKVLGDDPENTSRFQELLN